MSGSGNEPFVSTHFHDILSTGFNPLSLSQQIHNNQIITFDMT